MKNYVIWGSILLSLCITVNAQTTRCNDFHNGKFVLRGEDTELISRIERNDSLQVETVKLDTNVIRVIYIVKWIDNCVYTLTPMPEVFETHPDLPRNTFFTVRIRTKDEESYWQETTSNFSSYVSTGLMQRVE
jgi:hypothetical protein